MKPLHAISLLCTIIIIMTALNAKAGIDDGFDWPNAPGTNTPKRTLCVCYNFNQTTAKLGDTLLKDIMNEAISNWNSVSSQTGWSFETCTNNCDINVNIDSNMTTRGGASISGFPSSSSTNRIITSLTLKFDPTPAGGYKWDQAGEPKSQTKNPVSSAKHELSHAIRLDHQGGRRSVSRKIKDPQGSVTTNDDVIAISSDDIAEAALAATQAVRMVSSVGTSHDGVELGVPAFQYELPIHPDPPYIFLLIPPEAFSNAALIALSRTSMASMPDPYAVPDGVDRMMKGVCITAAALQDILLFNTGVFFTVVMPYEDGVEGYGYLIEVADPDWGELIEEYLQVCIFNPLDGSWHTLYAVCPDSKFFVDTAADLVIMDLSAPLLGMFPDHDNPALSTLFVSIGGPYIPEPVSWISLAAMLVLLTRRKHGL
jgi:hypothetical protein